MMAQIIEVELRSLSLKLRKKVPYPTPIFISSVK